MAPTQHLEPVLRRIALGRQLPARKYVCSGCQRALSTSAANLAGHNKWSKTKHIKAVTDKKKMSDRTAFTKLIAAYSRSTWAAQAQNERFCC